MIYQRICIQSCKEKSSIYTPISTVAELLKLLNYAMQYERDFLTKLIIVLATSIIIIFMLLAGPSLALKIGQTESGCGLF